MAKSSNENPAARFLKFRLPVLIGFVLAVIVGVTLWAVPAVNEMRLEAEREELAEAQRKADRDAERAENEAEKARECETLVSRHISMLALDPIDSGGAGRADLFVKLVGQSERQRLVERISGTFPFMIEAVAAVQAENGPYKFRLSQDNDYINGLMLQWLAAETSYSFAPSNEKLQEFLTNPDASSYDQEQKAWAMVRACWENLNLEGKLFPVDFDEIVEKNFSLMQAHLACEQSGFLETITESIPCADQSVERVSPDQVSGSTTQRNPFLDPYQDATQQLFAEFTWCFNQGLEVNSAGTGCR